MEILPHIENGSIDLVLADPPYGITACKWDSIIPLDALWPEIRRVLSPTGIVVLTSAQPFTTALISSNMRDFRYDLIWEKPLATGHLNAKKMPMRAHESICVFGRGKTYNPQKTVGHKRETRTVARGSTDRCYGSQSGTTSYDSTERYPRSVVVFGKDPDRHNGAKGLHPAQKPLLLMDYLVKTYSNEGDTVLDFCMGSGTTGVSALRNKRCFIGIEKDPEYFDMATRRIDDVGRNFKELESPASSSVNLELFVTMENMGIPA
ncbi:MAG: site-specific DNA-methyltransferase [Acetobacter malorum]|uniref:DNA-methyltransferase n=1 Tax=Acetobacter malorum TaxID=178901 RepID=UPI0039EB2462